MEGINIGGFYSYQLVDKNGQLKQEREFHNTLTGAALQMLLNKATGCVEIGGDLYGMQATSQYIDKLGNANDSQYNVARDCNNSRVLHNVLLNLSDNVKANLNDSTTFIDTFDSNFVVDANKVIAQTGNTLASGGAAEGMMVDCKSTYVMNKNIKAVRYKYDAGVATGTINCLAMMPGFCASNAAADGIATSKCVDAVNVLNANYASMSTGFLPPNIAPWTGDGEILLNYSQGAYAKHKVYLNGTTEPLDYGPTDAWPANLLPANTLDYYDDGTYLYAITPTSGVPVASTFSITVYLKSTMASVKSFSLSSKITYEYKTIIKFLKIGAQLYVNCASYRQLSTINGTAKLWTLSKGANEYWSSAGAAATDFSSILTIPTGVDLGQVCFGNYGNNYVMYIANTLVNTDTEGYKYSAFIFSSLTDIGGTKITKVCGMVPNQCLFYGNVYKGSIRIGNNYYGQAGANISVGYDTSQGNRIVTVGSNKYTMNANSAGCWISLENWSSSLFSFKNLSVADTIVKEATDVLYISWGIQASIVAS